MLEDLIKFGLILEFIGCLLVVVLVINLDKELLVKILFELKNVLVKQYIWLFEMDGVELEFIDDVLEVIVDQVIYCGIGVCGLWVIMEEVLLLVMYDILSCDDVVKVVVIKEIVQDNVLLIIVLCKLFCLECCDKSVQFCDDCMLGIVVVVLLWVVCVLDLLNFLLVDVCDGLGFYLLIYFLLIYDWD